MRERRTTTLAPAMALLAVCMVLLAPAALASSGSPATIGMQPLAAGPGAQIEVTGLDFPAGQSVDLQVTTPTGPVHLATVDVAEGGYFKAATILPADAPPGLWELRATTADGATALLVFEAGAAPVAAPAVAPASGSTPAAVSSQGNSAADIMVMLIVALLIAAVGGALAFAWYQTHEGTRQPGMGAGDDPIWSGANYD